MHTLTLASLSQTSDDSNDSVRVTDGQAMRQCIIQYPLNLMSNGRIKTRWHYLFFCKPLFSLLVIFYVCLLEMEKRMFFASLVCLTEVLVR